MKIVRMLMLVAAVTGGFTGPLAARQSIRELQIAPAQVELQIGERRSVLVTAFDRSGNVVPRVEFSWATEPSVVNVRRDVRTPNILYLDGVGYGATNIVVRAGRATASATVRVADPVETAPPPSTAALLRIDPANIFLLPTEVLTLTPYFLNQDGSQATGDLVTWQSLLGSVATVNDRGVVVGISPGQGVIQATSAGGLSARALVQVANTNLEFAEPALAVAPGQVDTVRVIVPAQNGRTIANMNLQWASTNVQALTVSPLGIVSGVRPGTAEIVVSGFGQQHRLQVTVHRPVHRMIVSPPRGEVAVPLSGTSEFDVAFQAADNSAIPEAPVKWQVDDTTVVRFDPRTRRALGRKPGTTRLHARGPGPEFTATWELRVVAGGVRVSRQTMGLSPGDTTTLSATLTDRDGASLGAATDVKWKSLDGRVAAIDNTGKATARGWGAVKVVAETPWGAADTVDLYVQGELLVTSTRTGSGDLYALDRGAPDRMSRITADPGAELWPSYSPDGGRIAYVGTSDGNSEIYVVNADGTGRIRLTTTPSVGEGAPQWTPDGRFIVYEGTERNKSQLWIMGADGANARPLTSGNGTNDQPSISPDGQWVAYRSDRNGKRLIHVMALDGSGDRAVTQPDAEYRLPRWFVDGTLGYIAVRKAGRRRVGLVERMHLGTQVVDTLTSNGISVSNFAVSADGDLLALVLQTEHRRVRTHELFLMPLQGAQAGMLVEVPRLADDEQLIFPAFRR